MEGLQLFHSSIPIGPYGLIVLQLHNERSFLLEVPKAFGKILLFAHISYFGRVPIMRALGHSDRHGDSGFERSYRDQTRLYCEWVFEKFLHHQG